MHVIIENTLRSKRACSSLITATTTTRSIPLSLTTFVSSHPIIPSFYASQKTEKPRDKRRAAITATTMDPNMNEMSHLAQFMDTRERAGEKKLAQARERRHSMLSVLMDEELVMMHSVAKSEVG